MELDVYLWTMVIDWVKWHHDSSEWTPLLGVNGPKCVEYVDFGAPAVILSIWRELTKVLVESLVWRDEEVKNCHNRTWMWFVLSSMLALLVAYGN